MEHVGLWYIGRDVSWEDYDRIESDPRVKKAKADWLSKSLKASRYYAKAQKRGQKAFEAVHYGWRPGKRIPPSFQPKPHEPYTPLRYAARKRCNSYNDRLFDRSMSAHKALYEIRQKVAEEIGV
jgi:hypothetical protein